MSDTRAVIRRSFAWLFAASLGWLAVVWGGVAGLAWLTHFILHAAFGGIGDWKRRYDATFIQAWFLPNGWNVLQGTAVFWVLIAILSVISGIVALVKLSSGSDDGSEDVDDDGYPDSRRLTIATNGVRLFAGVLFLIMAVVCVPMFWRANQSNDRDLAKYYALANEWISPSLDSNDPNTADSLRDLLIDKLPGDAECDAYGKHGVHACMKVGTLPDLKWNERSVSLAGAKRFMGSSAGTRSGVNLLTETMSYVYNPDGSGYWTGLIGGDGKRTHDYAVAEWDGSGSPTLCYFDQPEKNLTFNRAMAGQTKNSMVNLTHDKYYPLTWRLSDVSVYCDAKREPVIVVPMIEQVHIPGTSRTGTVPGGTLFIRGSASGDPVFDFRREVRAGEVPVPVYPLSIVAQQRDTLSWAAGRRIKDQSAFGYDLADDAAQGENASDYRLLNAAGGTDWATPVTPKGSSRLFVAYTLINADNATAGQLNKMRIYVLAKNDPRVVNIDRFEKPIRETISQMNPGFFGAGGTLAEYLPTQGGHWQVYAELNGQPVYRISVNVDHAADKVNVRIVRIEGNEVVDVNNPGTGSTTDTNSCKPQMTAVERARCLQGIGGQLGKEVEPKVATPTATPTQTPTR